MLSLQKTRAYFTGFAHVWTPLMRAHDLGRKPIAATVAGERLVLFRGEQGRATALLDQCPHRGAALSAGQVRDGCIECPFHGWRYDAAGQTRHIPLAPQVPVHKLGTVSFPVLEASGIIFLYTAPADPVHPPPPSSLAEAVKGWDGGGAPSLRENHFKAHWTRAIENALDFSHVGIVHHNSIGIGQRRAARLGARLETHWENRPYGAWLSATLDGRPAGELEYIYPNVIRLVFPGRAPDAFLAAVPEDNQSTRMLAFGPAGFSLANWLFKVSGGLVLQQDRRVVESQTPAEVPAPGAELSISSDRTTLAFRSVYDKQLRHSEARLGIAKPLIHWLSAASAVEDHSIHG